MSTAAHDSKQVRRLCQKCRDRKARFRYRGGVRADRDQTLCFTCYRSERDRLLAVRITEPRRTPPRGPFAQIQTLTPRQQTHRRLMLAHLQSGLQPGGGSTRTA
jgi:hypothetical protein